MANVHDPIPPGRLTSWTLASRTRYALTWGGAAVVGGFGIAALNGGVSRDYLLVAVPVALVALLVHAWVWYPRAKRRYEKATGATR